MPDGRSGSVRQCLWQDRCCSRTGGRGGHASRTSTMLSSLGGGRGLRERRSRAPRPAARRTSCHVRGGCRRAHPWSALVAGGRTPGRAGGREADGHPAGPADRRRHQHSHRHQPGHVRRTPAVRTAVVPEAADGQSVDRSGSLQLPLLFIKRRPAGGRKRPSSAAEPRTAGVPASQHFLLHDLTDQRTHYSQGATDLDRPRAPRAAPGNPAPSRGPVDSAGWSEIAHVPSGVEGPKKSSHFETLRRVR
jgi:hypothetical protein